MISDVQTTGEDGRRDWLIAALATMDGVVCSVCFMEVHVSFKVQETEGKMRTLGVLTDGRL